MFLLLLLLLQICRRGYGNKKMITKTHIMFRSISADARKTRFVTAALAKAEGKSDQLKVWIWYAHYSKTGGWNWHPYIHWHPYIVCTWIFVQEENWRQTISLTTFCHLKSYEKHDTPLSPGGPGQGGGTLHVLLVSRCLHKMKMLDTRCHVIREFCILHTILEDKQHKEISFYC